jgi:hypothetical protein
MFNPVVMQALAANGCYVITGQEYKLQHDTDEFEFRIRKGKYDRALVKSIIRDAFLEIGYQAVSFYQTPVQRIGQPANTTFDVFTAKAER